MHLPWLRFHPRVQILFLLFIKLTSISALAQTTLAPNSATSAAAGGAGRASVEPIDVHTLNPAMLVHVRNRDLHSVFVSRGWLIGMADNSLDNLIAGAFSYSSVKTGQDQEELRHQNMRLSLAGFVTEKLSMGVTIHQLESKADRASWMQHNADLGFSYIASRNLGFSFVMTDLMSSSLEDENPLRLRPRSALAVHGILNEFIGLRADVISAPENDFDQPTLVLGYEGALNEFVRFRAGWGHKAFEKQEFATTGFGLALPRFRLNYAYQAPVRGAFEHLQSIDLGIPF